MPVSYLRCRVMSAATTMAVKTVHRQFILGLRAALAKVLCSKSLIQMDARHSNSFDNLNISYSRLSVCVSLVCMAVHMRHLFYYLGYAHILVWMFCNLFG